MMRRVELLFSCCLLLSAGCNELQTEPQGTHHLPRQQASERYLVFVTNESSGDMSVIDSGTHEVIAKIPLGKRPRGIHASQDRRTLYVALSGSPLAPPGIDESTLPPPDKTADGIGVFHVQENRVSRVIAAGSDPEEFDLSQDGRLLYVSNEDVAGVSIVDLEQGKIKRMLAVGEEPEGVTTSPDGSFVYVTSENEGTVSVIDTAAEKVIKTVRVGLRPRDVAFLPDGSKAFVTLENEGAVAVLDARRHAKLKTITLGLPPIKPMAVILSPDSRQAYVSTGRGRKVFVIDTATERVTTSFEVGERPWGLALSPDGRTLYTANGPSNDVSAVDVSRGRVIKKIKVGDRPWGVITLVR